MDLDRALGSLLVVHLVLEEDCLILVLSTREEMVRWTVVVLAAHLVILLLHSARGLEPSHQLQTVVIGSVLQTLLLLRTPWVLGVTVVVELAVLNL